ncbi:MAG: hypothetical protein WHX52_00840 [Anaerolineae bacterium]
MGEDVDEGCCRSIGNQCERIPQALQFADDVRRAGDEVGVQRYTAGIFDFAALVGQRVTAVEADGEQMA